MAVRFTQAWRGGYWPGDVATFDDATEAKIVAAGAGEKVEGASRASAVGERGPEVITPPVTKPARGGRRKSGVDEKTG